MWFSKACYNWSILLFGIVTNCCRQYIPLAVHFSPPDTPDALARSFTEVTFTAGCLESSGLSRIIATASLISSAAMTCNSPAINASSSSLHPVYRVWLTARRWGALLRSRIGRSAVESLYVRVCAGNCFTNGSRVRWSAMETSSGVSECVYAFEEAAKVSPNVCVHMREWVGFASLHVYKKEHPIVPLPIYPCFKMGVNLYACIRMCLLCWYH